MSFEFPFNLIDKLAKASLTDQSWHVLKSWYTCGVQNMEFGAIAQTDITNSLVSSVEQASIIHDVLIFVLKVLGSAKSLLSNYVYKQITNKLTLYCWTVYLSLIAAGLHRGAHSHCLNKRLPCEGTKSKNKLEHITLQKQEQNRNYSRIMIPWNLSVLRPFIIETKTGLSF